ncbi:LlaJI family restriction endonuclease [Bacillus subtilis]|uniref:LlaJI family restriction endonuclease n=1 Tax=Bacillus TaxID=1386 RepID=UPI00100A1A1B|nr:LlaJI family restriction endonuclease [Bacillus subtilis]MEC0293194.1 LlaJI family restriction endonuclease [Bacillus subtilis]MEC0335346.1 LlaJI family restriction endonuclease [Bacillus subtilis]MEC0375093.1 LlaJI family restriction endonuclease [Bacillus subtilis]MEC0444323.1 LlaJI family restriction endonuclease [Bacillus subtilis]QAW02332.1 LlaJI family restriction endonuclease [Bacillus subtilis]
MLKSEWFIIQEGNILPEGTYKLFKDDFEIGDIGLKKNNVYISKFVGFILKKDKCLISFPKHYFSPSILQKYQPVDDDDKLSLNNDIKLLFRVIKKTAVKKSARSIGIHNDINSSYPLYHFFEVYHYFLNYGLYTNEREVKIAGYSGKIDWKNTMLKSPLIVSNNNLLYMPMIMKRKINEHAFISKCMAYVIDSTADFLSLLINIKRTNLEFRDINWNSNNIIIRYLRQIRQTIFKDKQKKLVDSLIKFFENEKKGSHSVFIKTRNFDLIWEEMIEFYLQHYFERINENGYIQFSNDKNGEIKPFKKRTFYPDIEKSKGRSIEPDYYLLEENARYIFDGKYYNEVTELNYKQIAYYFLLKHHENNKNDGELIMTYNILILPTHRDTNDENNYVRHFQLNPLFNKDETNFNVKEQYCNMKNIMQSYLN